MMKGKAGIWMFLMALLAALVLLPAVALGQEATGGDAAQGEEEESPSARRAREEREAREAAGGQAESPSARRARQEGEGGKPAYDMRVKELEEKVNDLKEKIFRSKSRLVILKETVLQNRIAGSKAVVIHKNDMGNSFKLEQAIYSLDGNQIYNKRDQDGDLADKEEFELFNGSIVPGKHNISVLLIYRGNGYGVFSYLQGYKFTIRSSYTFNAEEGKTAKVGVVAFEKGDFTTPLEERPSVQYEIELIDDQDGGGPVSEGSR